LHCWVPRLLCKPDRTVEMWANNMFYRFAHAGLPGSSSREASTTGLVVPPTAPVGYGSRPHHLGTGHISSKRDRWEAPPLKLILQLFLELYCCRFR
jgi:hypothetical protein